MGALGAPYTSFNISIYYYQTSAKCLSTVYCNIIALHLPLTETNADLTTNFIIVSGGANH